jgi:hypothetical protein
MRAFPHPLEEALRARVRLLATTLRPATVQQYEHTVRYFMAYLRHGFPEVRRANHSGAIRICSSGSSISGRGASEIQTNRCWRRPALHI